MGELGEGLQPSKKVSRRKFLSLLGLGSVTAGATALLAKTKGKDMLDNLKSPFESSRPLMEKEITGRIRSFVLEEAEGKWPVLHRKATLSDIQGWVKPGMELKGVEVWGVVYPSYLDAGRIAPDPQKPNQLYGKWVRVEGQVPLWDEQHNPILDISGNQKTAGGYFAENFVTFIEEQEKTK